MLDLQQLHELEQLIDSGHYSEARHQVRSMLHTLQEARQLTDGNQRALLAAELLSDTLDMLLLYRHEAQITTSPVRAARLLLQASH
jgi:Arc/MetJ-type ribon-helix-helix transcriptional regulator